MPLQRNTFLIFLLAGPGCVGGAEDTPNVDTVDTSPDSDIPDTGIPDSGLPDTGFPEEERLAINELLVDNEGSYLLDDGTAPDWIELFNTGSADVDLLGWSLSDDVEVPSMHVFAASIVVPPGGFVVLLADDVPAAGPTHLAFKLGADGEEVVLTAPEGRRVDWVSYGPMISDVAAARMADGDEAAGWMYVAVGTPGASNQGTSGE